jgi:hypothetical protein
MEICCVRITSRLLFPPYSFVRTAVATKSKDTENAVDNLVLRRRRGIIEHMIGGCEIGRRGKKKRGALAGLWALWVVPARAI